MKTSDYNFELPEHLIAQYPPPERGESRLMTLDRITGKREHLLVKMLPEILCRDNFLSPSGEKPLVVFNDTKVRNSRIYGKCHQTGKEVEFLLLAEDNNCWRAIAKRARRIKAGSVFDFLDGNGNITANAKINRFEEGYFFLEFDRALDDEWFLIHGRVPLPPYIKRKDTSEDTGRYQTVYAKETGSAAAPTAGLHFTNDIFDKLEDGGIGCVFITLHVGLGTFLPVRSEYIKDHIMHEEQFSISEKAAGQIEKAKENKRKIIAVGTTSLRALESAFDGRSIKRGLQSTSIFIYPGYKFKAVDVLFTNFHTPLSTLLMLVCAFVDFTENNHGRKGMNGKELILESYAQAVKEEYRFFSYGDAMLIF